MPTPRITPTAISTAATPTRLAVATSPRSAAGISTASIAQPMA